ncbi:hypothetical protein BC834DRAFT_600371 [Gloeopeniophorella convolvens]|nr:hypothetical protein BC834DRAFT_600371 [Gloeopeniophorella convolvens]
MHRGHSADPRRPARVQPHLARLLRARPALPRAPAPLKWAAVPAVLFASIPKRRGTLQVDAQDGRAFAERHGVQFVECSLVHPFPVPFIELLNLVRMQHERRTPVQTSLGAELVGRVAGVLRRRARSASSSTTGSSEASDVLTQAEEAEAWGSAVAAARDRFVCPAGAAPCVPPRGIRPPVRCCRAVVAERDLPFECLIMHLSGVRCMSVRFVRHFAFLCTVRVYHLCSLRNVSYAPTSPCARDPGVRGN